MIYFSTIINARVLDSNDEPVGRIADIAIDTKKQREFPSLRGILLSKDKKNGDQIFVEANRISAWSHDSVVLKSLLADAVSVGIPPDGVIFLKKSIVDRQIVDLLGVRVVRVNDLQFGLVRGSMSLLAMDVSTSGLFRRLGVTHPVVKLFKPHLLQWKDVHLIGDKLQLSVGREKLVKLHPADIANIVEKLNVKQGSFLLGSLEEGMAAKVMEEISPEIQKILVQHLGADRASSILEKMSMDELVDLIQLLPGRESREVLDKLPKDKNIPHVKKILEYDEDTAGGLMTTEFIYAHMDMRVADVIEQIRRDSHQHRSIYFVYVVDDKNNFLGVASLRRLILADGNQSIKEIMKGSKRTPVVRVEQNVADIASIMTKYNLLSVAVVDRNRRMLGIVTVDDIMRCLVPKA